MGASKLCELKPGASGRPPGFPSAKTLGWGLEPPRSRSKRVVFGGGGWEPQARELWGVPGELEGTGGSIY